MKKSFLLFIAANLLLTSAIIGQSNTWIKTSEGNYDCAKIKVHQISTNITLPNGEKKTLPTLSVYSYCVDGSVYSRMPLYDKGLLKDAVFMEFVKTVDDMSMYKYHDDNKSMDRFYVYKGNEYYMEIQKSENPEFAVFFQ